jgi:hypothetical protein
MKIRLQRVHYMPKELEPGVLYVSEEFGAAAHLCPCGCRSKVRTPLGPTDWALEETDNGPSLYPSIGNWQLPCQSHYWITEGRFVWSTKLTPKQIATDLRAEEERRRAYYDSLDRRRGEGFRSFWRWVKSLFK